MKPEKYMFQTEGSSVTWMCGLYRIENGLPFFVILTKDAGEELRQIHDRMPLILPEDKITEWIDPQNRPEDVLPFAAERMAYSKPDMNSKKGTSRRRRRLIFRGIATASHSRRSIHRHRQSVTGSGG